MATTTRPQAITRDELIVTTRRRRFRPAVQAYRHLGFHERRRAMAGDLPRPVKIRPLQELARPVRRVS